MCFDFLYNACLKKILILRRLQQDRSKMYIDLQFNYPLFLSDFNQTWIFLEDFRKIFTFQIFLEIRPLGAELFMRTEKTELIFANRRSADRPEKYFTAFYQPNGKGPWQLKEILWWVEVYRDFPTIRTVCQDTDAPFEGKVCMC